MVKTKSLVSFAFARFEVTVTGAETGAGDFKLHILRYEDYAKFLRFMAVFGKSTVGLSVITMDPLLGTLRFGV